MTDKMTRAKKNEVETIDADFLNGLPTGFEDTTSETFKTPFLRILQSQSDETKKKSERYVDGAEEGSFFNTATQKIYDEINLIVLKVSHDLVVWQPERGGFVGTYAKSEESEIVDRRDGAKKYDKEGNDVVDTISLYCVNADDYSDIFVFPLSGASLKHAKNFSTRLRTLKVGDRVPGVTFAGVWNIKTVLESNDKGSWYSIGNTPSMKRLITKTELDSVVKPGLEMLKKAVTDYSAVAEKESEDTDY